MAWITIQTGPARSSQVQPHPVICDTYASHIQPMPAAAWFSLVNPCQAMASSHIQSLSAMYSKSGQVHHHRPLSCLSVQPGPFTFSHGHLCQPHPARASQGSQDHLRQPKCLAGHPAKATFNQPGPAKSYQTLLVPAKSIHAWQVSHSLPARSMHGKTGPLMANMTYLIPAFLYIF